MDREKISKHKDFKKYDCSLRINNLKFNYLEISSYYQKHNEEYLESLKKEGIVLSEEELKEKLITNDLIQFLVKQLDGQFLESEGSWHDWTYYSFKPVFDENGKAYKLVWCLDNNDLSVIGIMDCFRQGKHDKKK